MAKKAAVVARATAERRTRRLVDPSESNDGGASRRISEDIMFPLSVE
jgi:hypothetical protein